MMRNEVDEKLKIYMDFLQKTQPGLFLRFGLGLTYLYSGSDLILHPTAWHWALPYWLRQIITSIVPLNTYLQIQGLVEIIFAFILIAWFLKPKIVRWVALLASFEFLAILLLAFLPWSAANFLFTFRDIGLLGASLALLVAMERTS